MFPFVHQVAINIRMCTISEHHGPGSNLPNENAQADRGSKAWAGRTIALSNIAHNRRPDLTVRAISGV